MTTGWRTWLLAHAHPRLMDITSLLVEFFESRIHANDMPYGFLMTHHNSNKVAFTVTFDGTGTVVGLADAATIADLLQTRK